MSKEFLAKRPWISLGVALAASGLAMAPVLWAQYTGWSDTDFIDRSPFWRHGILESLWLILIGKAYPTNANYAVSQTFCGFDVLVFRRNPHLSHLLNFVLHLVNVALVWQCIRLVLARALSPRLSTGQIVLAAGIGATLFGVHPLNVEPVAWISGREIELTLLFWLCAFLLLLSRRGGRARYAFAVAVYLLSAFSNGLAYGLPLVFAAWWAIVERLSFRKALFLSLPFFLIAAGAVGLRFSKQTPERRLAVETEKWGDTLGEAFSARARETRALVYPKGLVPFYPWSRGASWNSESAQGAALMAISAILIVWAWVRGTPLQRVLGFGLAWYWLAVALAFAHHHPQADRHAYCSALGLFMALGVLTASASERLRSPAKALLAAVLCAAVLALSVASFRQAAQWRTHKRLWQHALAVTKNNHVAHENVAFALGEEKDFDGAISHYRAALDLFPDLPDTHYSLGYALMEKGQTEEAFKHFRLALRYAPDDPVASGVMGGALLKIGKFQEAEPLFRKAIELDPYYADAHLNLGTILRLMGKPQEARTEFLKALESKRDFAEALVSLGALLADEGRWQEAIAYYDKALRLKPKLPEVHYNLGVAAAALGRPDDAFAHYEAALRVQPEYARAENGIGNLLLDLGRPEEAIPRYERALRIAPDYGEAENGLGSALNALGRLDEARLHFEKSVGIDPHCFSARYNLANLLLDTGRAEDAVAHYVALARLDPGFAEVRHRLAVALFQLDRMDDALARFAEALELDPENAQIRCNFGMALASVGRSDEATAQFRKTLELDPGNALAKSALDDIAGKTTGGQP